MKSKAVTILGKKWRVEYKKMDEDKYLKEGPADGYCDWTTRRIVIGDSMDGSLGDMDRYQRKVVRHEIIHAYLFESGLQESSVGIDAWARNEEMVDWFARMIPDMVKTWTELGCEAE